MYGDDLLNCFFYNIYISLVSRDQSPCLKGFLTTKIHRALFFFSNLCWAKEDRLTAYDTIMNRHDSVALILLLLRWLAS